MSANTPNVLLENNGHGQFQVVNARDAVGSSAGIGDTAITLDYDHDGLWDLYLGQGGDPSLPASPSQPGDCLYRNRGALRRHLGARKNVDYRADR